MSTEEKPEVDPLAYLEEIAGHMLTAPIGMEGVKLNDANVYLDKLLQSTYKAGNDISAAVKHVRADIQQLEARIKYLQAYAPKQAP